MHNFHNVDCLLPGLNSNQFDSVTHCVCVSVCMNVREASTPVRIKHVAILDVSVYRLSLHSIVALLLLLYDFC